MTEHAKIKADFASYEQELARGGNAAGVAQEMAKHARVAASEPDKLPVNLAVWGGVHDVVTRHRGALRGKLDAAAVLRSIDASTRAALANVRADLEATSAVDLTAAKRSARVLSFLATRYAGLTALLVTEGAAPAFAALLVGAHQVLEAARPSEARDGARETLLGTLDAAALRVAIALGGPFLRGVATTRPRGAATHADAVAAGRGAALLRLALAHGSELVELYPADAPSPLANDVLQTAVAACLATDAPDFALFVDGNVALLRLAAKRRLTDAVAALLLCANADDPRELELASLVWTAFLAGCDRPLRVKLLELLAAAGHAHVLDRALVHVDPAGA